MPRAFGRRDVSVTWPVCGRPRCGQRRHLSMYDCPPPGVWLVARACPACVGGTYCRAHAAHVR